MIISGVCNQYVIINGVCVTNTVIINGVYNLYSDKQRRVNQYLIINEVYNQYGDN